jgi:EAL domain-containing protein (putative c-di-GMP-specific phosphodiesterase class I)
VQNLDEILAGFGEAGGGATRRTMAARLTAVSGPHALIARFERPEEVATLQTYGCAVFQGFYFGQPMPRADFAQALRRQAAKAA